MSKAADGVNTATEQVKPSRRSALMMAAAVPLVAAPVALASSAVDAATPIFREILEARARIQPLLVAWWNMSPRNVAYEDAHDRVDAAYSDYQAIIDRLFAAEITSWRQVAEMNAVFVSECFDGDKPIGMDVEVRYILAIARAIEKLSGLTIPDFDGA